MEAATSAVALKAYETGVLPPERLLWPEHQNTSPNATSTSAAVAPLPPRSVMVMLWPVPAAVGGKLALHRPSAPAGAEVVFSPSKETTTEAPGAVQPHSEAATSR